MDRCSPLQADEILFIEAIRDLNRRASRLQTEENHSMYTHTQSTSSRLSTEDSSVDGGISSSSHVDNESLPNKEAEPPTLSEGLVTSSCSPI